MRSGISLKWFLVATLVLGCGGGMMLRLLTHDPRTFRSVVGLLATVAPILLLFGGALGAGLRRRSRWESPRCAACDEPLCNVTPGPDARCSACRQPLETLDQVRFEAVPRRDGRLLAMVASAVALPVLGMVSLWLCFPGGNVYAPVPTNRLIDAHFAEGVEEPWVWNELKRRLDSGDLSAKQVDAILAVVAGYAESERKAGRPVQFPWGSGFLSDPQLATLASDAALRDLGDKAFGMTTRLVVADRVRDSQRYEVVVASPGSMAFTDIGVRVAWDLTRVTIDGRPVEFKPRGAVTPGAYAFDLPASEEGTVGVEIELVYLRGSGGPGASGGFNGFDIAPRTSRSTWPDPIKRWTAKMQATPPPAPGE